jgi:hypothetical protein
VRDTEPMNWKSIRLELARTEDYPEGSASRVYLLRLPLKEDGLIDEEVLRTAPARATVRRFWPNEPDLSGYVIRTPKGWALSFEPGENDDQPVFHLEPHAIGYGERLTVAEPDGRKLMFRVASLEDIAPTASMGLPHRSPGLPRTQFAAPRKGLLR